MDKQKDELLAFSVDNVSSLREPSYEAEIRISHED